MSWQKAVEEDGFAVLPALFSAEWIDGVQQGIARLLPVRTRAGVRHALRLGPVDNLARHPVLKELSCAVLGTDAFPFRATLFDKSPGANWLVVWHQDTALPLRERFELPGWGPWSLKDGIDYAHAPASALSQVLALRVHLDDSSNENGPLRVLPRTHTLGVLSDNDIHDVAQRIAPVECLAPKGGVVAMRPLIVHASSKSRGDMPRKILHIEYAASDAIASPLQLATV
jgi:ectoine hydroxylase-related dioxygenase (phytanoyl-CoA dioxygenase family)